MILFYFHSWDEVSIVVPHQPCWLLDAGYPLKWGFSRVWLLDDLTYLMTVKTFCIDLNLAHRGESFDVKFLQVTCNDVLLYQIWVTQDWIQRGHLFVRKIILKSLLVNFVEKFCLALNKKGYVSNIKIRQVWLQNSFNIFYLPDFKLKVKKLIIFIALGILFYLLSLAVALWGVAWVFTLQTLVQLIIKLITWVPFTLFLGLLLRIAFLQIFWWCELFFSKVTQFLLLLDLFHLHHPFNVVL